MSLKAFHVVFIGSAIVLMLGLCGWSLVQFRDGNGVGHLGGALAFFAAATGLMVYGRYFVRKLRHISYL